MTAVETNFPPEWAAALREDALSPLADGARERAGLLRRLVSPRRVIIKVGTWYPNNPRSHGIPGRVSYVKSPPACQACGRRINTGENAVVFNFRKNPRGTGLGRTRYIHEHCPEEATKRDHEGSDRGRREGRP